MVGLIQYGTTLGSKDAAGIAEELGVEIDITEDKAKSQDSEKKT